MEYFTKYYGYKFASLDDFVIKYLGLAEGTDWKAETRVTAELDTKQNLIFHAIAQKEGMVITSADYQKTIQTYIDFYKQQYNVTYTASDIESMLGARMIKEYAIFEKVNNFLFDNCTIEYKD
jgi:FKBP-type peptidyl-prolyl cis-trans isomerase (trigger factor)